MISTSLPNQPTIEWHDDRTRWVNRPNVFLIEAPIMKATVYYAPGDVRVETVPDSTIEQPTDAIVRITHACICGSDLWFYRGEDQWKPGWRTGHEWMGIVEAVGADVRTLQKGDRVLAPFAFSEGSCEFCRKNLQTSCIKGGFWGGLNDGGQAEAIRAPFADATLVKIPSEVGKLDPSPVLDLTVNLAGVPAGYVAMDQRQAIKVMVKL
jgi:threonine dehydrogenase-like Zn-dependent dehydrogenase